jgi:large subunit ribosomal protein L3
MKFILGKKVGMTQVFGQENQVIPVTLIEAGPCFVVQIKTKDKDGYSAVQVGFEETKEKKINRPQKGHFKKALNSGLKFLREFKIERPEFKLGDKVDITTFNPGEIVRITSISKGKGFQGVVKRHGFSGMPASHGTKHTQRAPGSIGSAFPERVLKGKKMAGRLGGDKITIQGLEVTQVDKENNLLAVKGAVPGSKGALLKIEVTKEIAEVKEEKEEKLIADLEKQESEAKKKKAVNRRPRFKMPNFDVSALSQK